MILGFWEAFWLSCGLVLGLVVAMFVTVLMYGVLRILVEWLEGKK